MHSLAGSTARRLRPQAGYPAALLALLAACSPAIAAADSTLRLPVTPFLWAGALGVLLGMGLAPREAHAAPHPRRQRSPWALLRRGLALLALLLIGVSTVISAGATLPPPGLVYQDVVQLMAWAAPLLERRLPDTPPPPAESLAFLELALSRYWAALPAAVAAGESGARLLVGAAGVALTWVGALALGWALPVGRQPLAWGTPLLAALVLTAVLGGSGGTALAIGTGALVLAAVAGGARAQRAAWDRSGTDYSDEITRDVLGWGLGLVIAALLAAWIVPLWPGNPIAKLFAEQELPSGIAAMQRGLEQPRQRPPARVGLSTLPAVLLGESLEQGPPEQVALRVRVPGPLPEGPVPRYWRVRVLNLYTGSGWGSDATVGAQPPTVFGDEVPEGLVAQEVEDLRREQGLVPGLADVIGVNVPASVERLPDGSLAALVAEAPAGRYRVLSRPMELAPLPPADREPPDMRAYLGLPRGVPQRVRDLASIVSGSGSLLPAQERALLIERYLRELPYTYEVEPLPRGGDAVDQFLFDMRQGYCTYYASAMAVMARSVGIPARVAVGYATGTYDEAAGAYVVREAEAHAWPELYINGRWTIFEPTPVRPLPARATAQPGAPDALAVAEAEQAPRDRTTGPLVWAGVLALVALVTAAGFLLGRPRPQPPLVERAHLALERFGAREGVAWPRGATLHEYGALLIPHTSGNPEALHDVVTLVELARYGAHGLAPDEERRLLAASERLGDARTKNDKR
ncbi:MAG: hypothetical protein RLZZ387_5285 [Chloroflexota bacterium]